MSVMVTELYQALRAASVPEAAAVSAAEAVVPRSEAATKTDIADLKVLIESLRGEMHRMKADIIIWTVGAMIAMTGLFTWIVNALVRR